MHAVCNLPVNDEKFENTGKILPVNKTQRQLLELLLENPNLTYDELAEKLSKTRETVRTNLRQLEEKQLVKRVGADKNGHWEIRIQRQFS